MSKTLISIAEKPILNHLRDGGSVENLDENLISNFFETALRDDEVRQAVLAAQFSPEDLCLVLITMLKRYPHHCLNVGGPLLVSTLVFMEPFRLESIGRLSQKYEQEGKSRQGAIIQAASEIADVILSAHEAAGKTMDFVSLKIATEKRNNNWSWILGIGFTILLVVLLKSCK